LNNCTIREATTADLPAVRELFLEYAASLEISLCFQNFEEELATLPGKYGPPGGCILLGLDAAAPAGCVALRPIQDGICEMKRLYVRPQWRRGGIGRLLASNIISRAQQAGYDTMRLDTLASLQPAIDLYHSLGFRKIGPYNDNPSPIAVFMELSLKPAVPAVRNSMSKAS